MKALRCPGRSLFWTWALLPRSGAMSLLFETAKGRLGDLLLADLPVMAASRRPFAAHGLTCWICRSSTQLPAVRDGGRSWLPLHSTAVVVAEQLAAPLPGVGHAESVKSCLALASPPASAPTPPPPAWFARRVGADTHWSVACQRGTVNLVQYWLILSGLSPVELVPLAHLALVRAKPRSGTGTGVLRFESNHT